MHDDAMMNDLRIFVDEKIMSVLYNNSWAVTIENNPSDVNFVVVLRITVV